MRKSRFTTEQIMGALRDAQTMKAIDVCKKLGISEPTFYNWKKKYGSKAAAKVKTTVKAKSVSRAASAPVALSLADENRRLRELVASLSYENALLRAGIAR